MYVHAWCYYHTSIQTVVHRFRWLNKICKGYCRTTVYHLLACLPMLARCCCRCCYYYCVQYDYLHGRSVIYTVAVCMWMLSLYAPRRNSPSRLVCLLAKPTSLKSSFSNFPRFGGTKVVTLHHIMQFEHGPPPTPQSIVTG